MTVFALKKQRFLDSSVKLRVVRPPKLTDPETEIEASCSLKTQSSHSCTWLEFVLGALFVLAFMGALLVSVALMSHWLVQQFYRVTAPQLLHAVSGY